VGDIRDELVLRRFFGSQVRLELGLGHRRVTAPTGHDGDLAQTPSQFGDAIVVLGACTDLNVGAQRPGDLFAHKLFEGLAGDPANDSPLESDRCRPARDCDFVLVNLFHPPLGAPMRPGVINELLTGHVSLAVSAQKELAE
jgi:hypothetical protein